MAEGVHEDREKYPALATYRLSALALPRRFLCLDHDGYRSPEVFKDVIRELGSFSGFAYNTFSSTPEAPRARIVLELTRSVDRGEGVALGEAFDRQLTEKFGREAIKSDPTAYRAEQPCFSPGEGSEFFLFRGDPLEVDRFLSGCSKSSSKQLLEIGQRRRPTRASILKILRNIDPFPEPAWFRVACILARVYGEDGRELFLSFSKGDYWSTQYKSYDEREANAKFDRALREQKTKETGAGLRALLRMAGLSLDDIEFEKVERQTDSATNLCTNDSLGVLISEFGLIVLGGQIRVVRQREVVAMRENRLYGGISLYQRRDAELLMKRCLVERNLPYSSREITAFFVGEQTIQYEATAFSPLELPTNLLNYWVEPIRPVAGLGTEPIYAFIQDVICSSDKKVTTYLLDFLAHMLQYPEIKPGVAIILLGGQGVGKGTFFELLRAIWRRTTLIVQDIDQVVGKFNSALERHFVVCMDEAIFRGDRKASERLKALVTEPVIRVEEKYEPGRTIESFHRFFAATNSNHFGQVDVDDRRYLFLRVSSSRRCQHDYFSTLHALFENTEVVSAFVHYLCHREIDPLSIFHRPVTSEHTSQRVLSLSGFHRFWHDFLVQEGIPAAGCFMPTEHLLTEYRDYSDRDERFAKLQANELSRQLSEVCPSSSRARGSCGEQASRRGYNLPPLTVCRAEFEVYIGTELDWDIAPGVQPRLNTVF